MLSLQTVSKALGNSPTIADKHYVKPQEVLPDVRKAVNDAVSGLTDVQLVCNEEKNITTEVVEKMAGTTGLEPAASAVTA